MTPTDRDDPAETMINCENGEIRLWNLSGRGVDPNSELDYEFVLYDQRRSVVVIAVYIGPDGTPAQTAFDELFSFNDKETSENDRAFLVVPATPGRISKVKAWALAPTAENAHTTCGYIADPAYINNLIRTVKL